MIPARLIDFINDLADQVKVLNARVKALEHTLRNNALKHSGNDYTDLSESTLDAIHAGILDAKKGNVSSKGTKGYDVLVNLGQSEFDGEGG